MIDKPPLLSEEPGNQVASLRELVGIASAIEAEAVARYALLAQLMERHGEHATAATFRDMCKMEQHHVEMVARWSTSLNLNVPPSHDFAWRVPREIAESWAEVEHSSLLTPYRALSIAVVNEERAFAFYAYIAARAADQEVQVQAEAMAREELAHAAELRVKRRHAYHRERPVTVASADLVPETVAAFRALEGRLEREAAAVHREIARMLAEAGDATSAALVDAMARREDETGRDGETSHALPDSGRTEGQSLILLRGALRPLERISEIYEDLVSQAVREDLLAAEQAALQGVVRRIASLGRRISEIEAQDESR